MYQSLVANLSYVTHTRPCIAFVVSFVSPFMHDPRNSCKSYLPKFSLLKS